MDISVFISIIALLVSILGSIFIAWKNYLSPFSISIQCGNPRLELLPVKLPMGHHVMRFTVILPLQIVNNGAKDGFINDIVLNVRNNEFDWFYYPTLFSDYTVSNEATLGENLTKKSSNIPFHPIHLNGRESLYESILFIPDSKNQNYPLGSDKLTPGKYCFAINILEQDKVEYEEKQAFNITFDEDGIKEMNETTSPLFLVPNKDELKDNRKNFGMKRKASRQRLHSLLFFLREHIHPLGFDRSNHPY